jgi:hypothetical protein
MQLLQTIIILLPLAAIFLRTERRLTKIETDLKWIVKKLNGDKTCVTPP